MYKAVGVRFVDFISFFKKNPMKMKLFGLTETKLFHVHRILKKNGGGEAGRGESSESPLDPPLLNGCRFFKILTGCISLSKFTNLFIVSSIL